MNEKKRQSLKLGLGASALMAFPFLAFAKEEIKKIFPKSPPVWATFGINGSLNESRYELTKSYVDKYNKNVPEGDELAFVRIIVEKYLKEDASNLVRFSEKPISVGEDYLLGMAQDYESVVTLRRVDLQKKVSDGILFTFMAGVGLIVTYKKNVGWILISSFPFVTRDERAIPDVGKAREFAIQNLDKIYETHAKAFTTFLNRFGKWNAGFSTNVFAKVTLAKIGKAALPKLQEFKLTSLLNSNFIGFESSAAICDGLNIPLLPFQLNNALTYFESKYAGSEKVGGAINNPPQIDLGFEIILVDLIKEKIVSTQRGVIFLKRQIVINLKINFWGDKIFQTFAAAPVDEDIIGILMPEDDTPERDFIFFDRLLYRTLSLLTAGILNNDKKKLESLGVEYESVAASIPKILEVCKSLRI